MNCPVVSCLVPQTVLEKPSRSLEGAFKEFRRIFEGAWKVPWRSLGENSKEPWKSLEGSLKKPWRSFEEALKDSGRSIQGALKEPYRSFCSSGQLQKLQRVLHTAYPRWLKINFQIYDFKGNRPKLTRICSTFQVCLVWTASSISNGFKVNSKILMAYRLIFLEPVNTRWYPKDIRTRWA